MVAIELKIIKIQKDQQGIVIEAITSLKKAAVTNKRLPIISLFPNKHNRTPDKLAQVIKTLKHVINKKT